MSTKLKDLIPILICEDVQKSIRFYVDVLDFKVVNEMKDVGRSGWASLQNGSASVMLGSPTDIPETPTIDGRHQQVVHYFYPEDVEALRDSVVAKGYAVSDLRVAFYEMKEFDLVDPDGHVLWSGQETDDPPTTG
jgi:uncharacterized glyoxalase superfamily protein PhnB